MDNNELSTNLAEVGTDAVSREAVKKLAYSQIRSMYCGVALKEQRETMLRIADNVIGLLPSVTPKQQTGKWIDTGGNEEWYAREYKCSECGGPMLGETNFCPNCGADMRTAEQIVHDAIDNTPMAEDAYPGIKERLHKAVDDMREVTNGN